MYCKIWKDRFRVVVAGGGDWRIESANSRFLLTQVTETSIDADFDAIECTWRDGGVTVRLLEAPAHGNVPGDGNDKGDLATARVIQEFRARSVFVHEPRPALYAVMPLPEFGAAQRRFWWRVFRVVRLPGGRWLLGLLARRARA